VHSYERHDSCMRHTTNGHVTDIHEYVTHMKKSFHIYE